jgi:uridylate kinase
MVYTTVIPEKNPNAVKFDKISFAKVISMGLSVMDMTAFHTYVKKTIFPSLYLISITLDILQE